MFLFRESLDDLQTQLVAEWPAVAAHGGNVRAAGSVAGLIDFRLVDLGHRQLLRAVMPAAMYSPATPRC